MIEFGINVLLCDSHMYKVSFACRQLLPFADLRRVVVG